MLIVSWNVAGLKPALQKIHSDYGSSSISVAAAASSASSTKSKSEIGASAKKKDSIDPFANYIRLHGDVDILCLQEHKIPLTQLSSRSEPQRCSSIEGYVLWISAGDRGSIAHSKRARLLGVNRKGLHQSFSLARLLPCKVACIIGAFR